MIKQTMSLLISQVIGRVLGFIVLIYLGNVLGVVDLGAYGTMLTLLMISTILSTFGLDLWLSRHVANHDLSFNDFMKILAFRFLLTGFLLGIGAVLFLKGLFLSSLKPHALALFVMLASLFLDHIGLTAQAVLEGRRNLVAIGKLTLVRWGVFGGAASLIHLVQPHLLLFCFCFLLGALARAIAAVLMVLPNFSQEAVPLKLKGVFLEAGTMALLNTMVGLYFHIDMVMIPEMDSLRGAGFYKTAYTMVEALLFISGAVASSLYPLFSHQNLPFSKKWECLESGVFLLQLLAFPICFCTPFVSEELVKLLFIDQERALEFLPASSALNVLVWALPGMFANINLVRLLLGLHRQKAVLLAVSWTAFMNVLFNFLLIPRIGFMGAAYATVGSETILTCCLLGMLASQKRVITIWKPFVQPALLASLSFGLAWSLRTQAVWIIIPGTVIGYVGILWGLGIVTRESLSKFGKI